MKSELPNELSIRIGRKIRQLRKEVGLTGAEFARKLTEAGYPAYRQTVFNVETGKTRVSIDLAAASVGVLGTTLDELVKAGECGTCAAIPPDGFTCNECGRTGTEGLA